MINLLFWSLFTSSTHGKWRSMPVPVTVPALDKSRYSWQCSADRYNTLLRERGGISHFFFSSYV